MHLPLSASGIEFRCATSREELEPLLGYYRGAQSHVEADPDAIGLAAAHGGHDGRPFFLTMLSGGQPRAMLAGHVTDTEFRWRVGYLRLWTTRARVLTIVNGGVVGEPDAAISSLLWRECLRRLSQNGAHAVKFTHLSTASSFYQAVSREPGWLARDPLIAPFIHYRLELPDSFEAFVTSRSPSIKRDIKNTSTRFRKKFDGQFDVVCYRSPGEVDEAMQAAEVVARVSYQRSLGVGFRPTPETRTRWIEAAERGWLRVYVLRIKGVPVAYMAGHNYGQCLFGESTAFDPQYRDDRVGIFIWIQLIEMLCNAREARRLDFGSGDAEYKRRFSSDVIDEADVFLFAPGLKGAYLRLMRLATVGLHSGLRALLERYGLVDWVKTRWRRRMAPPSPEGQAAGGE